MSISKIFAVFFVFSTFSLPQIIYYVSSTGSNNNSGLKINEAFETLQHAADIVTAGDSVLIMNGTYSGFDIRTSGTSELPITFKALGENVIIDQPNPVTNDGINIESADWVVIDGFNVVDQPRAGIRVVTSDFVVIKNNTCSNNYRWGIFTGFTDDILIENNSCSYSEDEHGIYVSNSSDRPVIINNHSFFNNGCGIHMNGDASMGGDGIISNAVVAGNIIHDNGLGGGSAINMDGVQESVIYNNLLYNNHSTGIAMYMIDGAEGSKNNKVFNNTIVNLTNTRWNILSVNGSTGNTVYNNILINHHSFRGSVAIDQSSKQGFISDYNILENRLSDDDGNSNMNLNEWQALGYDLHSVIADSEDEIFANHNTADFQLITGSQAIDAGTSLVSSVVNYDLNNISRPSGNGFDIGAYEFGSATGISEENIIDGFNLYQNYPNPFNPATKIKFSIPNVEMRHASSLLVSLKIYDLLGKEVETLVNEEKPAGDYEVEFSATGGSAFGGDVYNLSSGIYFYTLRAGNLSQTKKFILLK